MADRMRGVSRQRVGLSTALTWLALTLFVLCPTALAQDTQGIETLERMAEAFASVAEKASPAVVGIRAEWTVERSVAAVPGMPEDFFEFFFRRRGPEQQPEQRQRRQRAQGSGFILSSDGHIVTNSHVVSQAERVRVDLRNGVTVDAEVVGTDPESDVAVIKVDSSDLPTLPLANSEDLKVGEWVLAIGSPLGLSHTVTAGIVSAKGRSGLRIASYENFIQTDAAINMGNSGGPLVDLRGRAVGINTAIVGPGGGNIGIGFAIPINMAKDIADQLIQTGTVERGYLGVVPQELTAEMAEALGVEDAKGVILPQVTEGSAADEAGLQRGDIVLQFDGQTVESATQFRNLVAERKPGERVRMVVLRDGYRESLTVTLDRRPSVEQMRGQTEEEPADRGSQRLGLAVQNLTPDLAQQFGYEDQTGVIVTRVVPGSQAAEKGVRPGFLIEEVERQKVANVRQFERAVREGSDDGQLVLLVSNGQSSQYVILSTSEEER
jgi:serine protease Do